MNLDHHQIAIRPRGMPALCDLAFQVLRRQAGPMALLLLLNAAPWIALNWLILQLPLWSGDWQSGGGGQGWLQMLLVGMESQAGTALVSAWLGRAMFDPDPDWRASLADGLRRLVPLFWSQLVLRPVLPVLGLLWLLGSDPSGGEATPMLVFGVVVGCLMLAAIRAMRPFAGEIVLLERAPMFFQRRPEGRSVSYSKRSYGLHTWAGSMLVGRALFGAGIAWLLALALYGLMMFLDHSLTIQLGGSPAARQWIWTAALWLTAGYFAVVRFLCYIDLRVRQEGWDTELRIRAEAMRLAAT